MKSEHSHPKDPDLSPNGEPVSTLTIVSSPTTTTVETINKSHLSFKTLTEDNREVKINSTVQRTNEGINKENHHAIKALSSRNNSDTNGGNNSTADSSNQNLSINSNNPLKARLLNVTASMLLLQPNVSKSILLKFLLNCGSHEKSELCGKFCSN